MKRFAQLFTAIDETTRTNEKVDAMAAYFAGANPADAAWVVYFLGGGRPKGLDQGCYVSPTLFTGVKNDMRIAKEEIFGPVTGVIPYKKLDDAIAIANDSIYGLAASIWTSDVSTAHKAARDIEAGIVWVNCFDHGDMTSIWGGFKQSGMGRDKCLETLTTVTQTKSVWMHLG